MLCETGSGCFCSDNTYWQNYWMLNYLRYWGVNYEARLFMKKGLSGHVRLSRCWRNVTAWHYTG